jgi:hypothetical protein
MRSIEIKQLVTSEMFTESDQSNCENTTAHKNDMLLHVIVMVIIRVQVRTGNKMLKNNTSKYNNKI